MPTVEIVNWMMSLGALALQIVIIILAVVWFSGKKDFFVFNILEKNGMFFAYLIALLGLLGSLYYSDVVGYAPCVLCWFQRIFLYPQVFILGYAIYKGGDKNAIPYALILSVIGMFVSLYHNFLQIMPIDSATCSIFSTVSCTEDYFTVLGYLNIPSITLTAFVTMILCLIFANKYQKNG